MFDLRVVNRYIATSRVTKEEYAAHLETLPDAAENVRPREEGGDDDGYDRPISPPTEARRLPLSALFTRPKRDPSDDDDDDDDDDDFDDDEDGDDDDGDDAGDAAEGAAEAGAAEAGAADAGAADAGAADEAGAADDAGTADDAAPAGDDDAPKDA